jgi:hypothetical protein
METSDERNESWETVVDFTEIDEEGVPARDILKALENITISGA